MAMLESAVPPRGTPIDSPHIFFSDPAPSCANVLSYLAAKIIRPRLEILQRMQAYASGIRHNRPGGQQDEEDDAASANYVLSLPSCETEESAGERANFFTAQVQEFSKHEEEEHSGIVSPRGRQASTLMDLMMIRAMHGKLLGRLALGTAVGFRTRDSKATNVPAVIAFVARKLHPQWLMTGQMLPETLEGPGGIWCDVDVVEFSYHSGPATAPKEQPYSALVENLRGNDIKIGPGSQVASLDVYGTMGAIVRSRVGGRKIGFITNRHVAVDLDYPFQRIYHPLPPNLGPGIYLGSVERATSFITDDLWYGVYAACSPVAKNLGEAFVRADGAFVPFANSVDLACLTASVRGVGDMGKVYDIDLNGPIDRVVGRRVVKLGRSTGLTSGTIIAYAVEYHDDKGLCFFTDLLVIGEGTHEFDMEGDSGSVIMVCCEEGQQARPIGMIWGGTSNRGRLKLRQGCEPQNWTSCVDLGRLARLLQIDILYCDADLTEAWKEQHPREPPEILPSGGEDSSKNPGKSAHNPSAAGGAAASEDVSLHLSLGLPESKRSRLN